MEKILKSYLRKLTNLTGNNRSLLLLRLSSGQDLDLNQLDFLNDKPSFSLIESLISGKKTVLCAMADSRDSKVNEASRQIRILERRDRFIFEERGARDLYLGWPFVRGRFSDGTAIRCPLVFFPVTIRAEKEKWLMELREDEPATLNKSFLLAYSYYNKINLPEELLDSTYEDAPKDVQFFLTQVYKELTESPLELNFNQDLFTRKLHNFENFRKPDYEEKYNPGQLILHPEAVLGIFPQAGSYLVPDYEQLLENPAVKDLEEFFAARTMKEEGEHEGFRFIRNVREEQTFTPFRMDASQENALKAVKTGNSVVVQGPPGTGKSQLICNLISDFIARGKNVLLVCQKRAALDVVHQRLKEAGVAEFTALVHDFKQDRKAIYQQVNSQIERLEEYKTRNNSLDSLYLERTFLQASRDIDQLTEELEEFREALFNDQECGMAIKELYLSSDPDAPSIYLKQEYKYFNAEKIREFENKIKRWTPYAAKFNHPGYIWNDRVSFRDFTTGDLKKIDELLDKIPYFQAEVSEQIREILGVSLDLEDCEWIADREEKVLSVLSLLEEPGVYEIFKEYIHSPTELDELILREKKVIGCFKGEGIEVSLDPGQLNNFQQVLLKASDANRRFHKWVWWRLFSKDKFQVKRVFVANGLDWTREGFEKLIRRLDNRMNLEHNITRLKEMGWVSGIPEEKDLQTFEEWFHRQHTAVAATEILRELRSLKDLMPLENVDDKAFRKNLKKILEAVRHIPAKKKKWQEYFTIRQISRMLDDYEYAVELKNVLKKDFDSLIEFDKIEASMLQHEREVMRTLYASAPEKSVQQMQGLFSNSIRLEWIDHIETKYPVLRSVGSLKMEQAEEELQQKVEEKLSVSKEILLLRTRERTYKNLNYNRLNNIVTYRDLKHQVSKKKKVWPLRKLVGAFPDELFDLVPCWMASPESVSAIFPMEQLFDLVIFDEASQCFSEKGIPAMYRGRQVVIAGDEKQLSPNDLYSVRYEEEEEDIPELEIDSLLDLGSKYLMQVQLKGHYRSKSPDLIGFSNEHFYSGTLRLLPSRAYINESGPAIKYIKTEGIWKNNCNQQEAEQVTELVFRLISEDPEASIGVVTFNFRQQLLIQDLLETEAAQRKRVLPESLIIKNIENIQGDERDIIIFSTGYAPNMVGHMGMHFGSLNQEKGENRLNVAVTRARNKVYLVTSIMPHELNTDNAKHEGPKLLKKYLQYALDVSEGRFTPKPSPRKEYFAGWMLKDRVKDFLPDKVNISLEEELPFADLTVKEKGKYRGVVLTDDDLYHQSLSVKDFHAYLPVTLSAKEWALLKLFSREYWRDKVSVKEKIEKAFRK